MTALLDTDPAAAKLTADMINLIDTGHPLHLLTALDAPAAVRKAVAADPDLAQGRTLAQLVGDHIHRYVVGEHLPRVITVSKQYDLQNQLWETWAAMVDWEQVGAYYLHRAQGPQGTA